MAEEPIYLDSAATTRVDPRVVALMTQVMLEEFGNAGSRTHQYGSRAKSIADGAREQVASAIGCTPDEVIFTSGATESDNLAILGLADHGRSNGRRHIISTAIEHKAVLEPLEHLQSQGFEVTLVTPDARGWIEPAAVQAALREDTLLVSIMHANNETGIIQPIEEIAEVLHGSDCYFHIDAAQGFTKDRAINGLQRADLISISGHKINAPKGIGALITRKRRGRRPPLVPLMYGGGQEHGVRPGTLPVPLVAALGLASELGHAEFELRRKANLQFRQNLTDGMKPLEPVMIGDQSRTLPNILSLVIPGINSEAFILATKQSIALSNGSACTSHSYKTSHVLDAMGLSDTLAQTAVRFSWEHMSPDPDWRIVHDTLQSLT